MILCFTTVTILVIIFHVTFAITFFSIRSMASTAVHVLRWTLYVYFANHTVVVVILLLVLVVDDVVFAVDCC